MILCYGGPKSDFDLIQECGRAGRGIRPELSIQDYYNMCCSFGHFIYMAERNFVVDPDNLPNELFMSIEDQRDMAVSDLISIMKLFFWIYHAGTFIWRISSQLEQLSVPTHVKMLARTVWIQ